MSNHLSPEDKKAVKDFYAIVFPAEKKECSEIYNQVAAQYDRITEIIGVQQTGKKVVKDLCERLGSENLHEKCLIDIGCCTGTVGERLKEMGFKQFDGLDVSPEALKKCEEKKIYRKLYNVPLSADPTPGIAENTYDAAISVGCFVEGHIPMNGIRELARIVKPGGFISYTLHDPRYTKDYMAVHGELIKDKLAELQLMQLIPYKREHTQDFEWVNGYLVVFKVL